MACTQICAFDAIAYTDFTKGFVSTTHGWQVETLNVPSRSRDFVIPGCAGVKWSLAVEKRAPNSSTTIGLYCKDAPSLVPAVFRIALYDGDGIVLMNRSCYFTFCGGSSGCGFAMENWTVLECRIRMQNRSLLALLVVDVPKDRGFLAKPCATVIPERWTSIRREHMKTVRADFKEIESNGSARFSDLKILVGKSVSPEQVAERKDEAVEEIHCHCHVVCSHSPVFSRMLEKRDFVESAQRVIDISKDADVDRPTMIALLRYMYCGEVGQDYEKFKVNLDDIVRLLNVAEKYEIAGLKSWSESCMIAGYDTDEQRRKQLAVADMFGLKQLKAICVAQLSSDPEPFKAEAFTMEKVEPKLMEEVLRVKKRKNAMQKITLK